MVPRVGFVFPGQGSQRVGMLRSAPLLPIYERALGLAERSTGMPLRRIADEGPDAALADSRVAQPLLYIADLAWAEALRNAGVTPELVAGHSLGELAALTAAGVVTLDDGIMLVSERGRIMAEVAERVRGTMSAVLGMDRDTISGIVDSIDGVWLANDNSASQAVISGTYRGVETAIEALSGAGARRVVPLDVAGPFHCPLMAPAEEAFAEVLGSVHFGQARVPVVQNTEPLPATDASTLRARLAGQITAPVRWRETMDEFVRQGISLVVEAGPGAVLTGIAKRLDGLTGVSIDTDGVGRVMEVLQR
jgi:[acyl-carrier-protein] S-malonyltransferase